MEKSDRHWRSRLLVSKGIDLAADLFDFFPGTEEANGSRSAQFLDKV